MLSENQKESLCSSCGRIRGCLKKNYQYVKHEGGGYVRWEFFKGKIKVKTICPDYVYST
jgi:pyruvate dehydrogenase complex dehydrogenase (E1) component